MFCDWLCLVWQVNCDCALHPTSSFLYSCSHKIIGLFRSEAQVIELEEELRGTLAGLIKAEKAVKEGTVTQTRLVNDKIR